MTPATSRLLNETCSQEFQHASMQSLFAEREVVWDREILRVGRAADTGESLWVQQACRAAVGIVIGIASIERHWNMVLDNSRRDG